MTELYFDVRKFDKSEFALLVIENKVGELKERVSDYRGFKVDVLGIPDFPFKQIKETDKREIGALFLAQKMARDGYNNFLWISAPGGEYDHPESRFTWLRAANVTGDQVFFDDNKAICGSVSQEKCLVLAKCLVEDGGTIWGEPKDAEELRGYVIGFKDDKIIERLAEGLEEMDEVWKAIKNGDDKKNLGKMMEVAEWVEANFGQRMKNVFSKIEAIRVGAMIEMQVRQTFGIGLMAGGVHGMSNSAAMGQKDKGAFEIVFGMANMVSKENLDPRLEKCDHCGSCFIKKKKKCPRCYPQN